MKKTWLFVAIALAVGSALAVQNIPVVSANDDHEPNVFSRNSTPYGRTYSEWSVAWEQWTDSIPAASHPLFDNGDCSTAQSGPVWFLGGKFCANGASCNYSNVVRSCNVPSTKALYFPVMNFEDSALEESIAENPGNPWYEQVANLRSTLETWQASPQVFAAVDGEPIPRLQQNFKVQSAAFNFTLPENNLFTSIYGVNFPAGTYFPGVDDGWYVMLQPLPPGHHVLQFGGTNGTFTLNVKYFLNVTR